MTSSPSGARVFISRRGEGTYQGKVGFLKGREVIDVVLPALPPGAAPDPPQGSPSAGSTSAPATTPSS